MKKTVIIILAILPIVLVIAIAFAGRIFSIYRHVPVEKVVFLDTVGEDAGADYTFTVSVGQTKPTDVRVYPDLASNKSVSYISSDENICTVDSDGNITGVAFGTTTVMVKTFDGGKTAMLNVRVSADKVTGVTLNASELELVVGSAYDLVATVVPYAALNKSVIFASDNTSVVNVNSNGKLTAIAPGTATVSVTTVDGGYTATCTVTVSSDTPPIFFDFEGVSGITPGGVGYIVTLDSLDLSAYMTLHGSIDPSDVRFEIVSGSQVATLSGSTLTFTGTGIVTVAVYTSGTGASQNRIEIRMLHS